MAVAHTASLRLLLSVLAVFVETRPQGKPRSCPSSASRSVTRTQTARELAPPTSRLRCQARYRLPCRTLRSAPAPGWLGWLGWRGWHSLLPIRGNAPFFIADCHGGKFLVSAAPLVGTMPENYAVTMRYQGKQRFTATVSTHPHYSRLC